MFYFRHFILDYFEYIIKEHETIANNPLLQIDVNKIKKKIVFKLKTDYKLELLSSAFLQIFFPRKLKF